MRREALEPVFTHLIPTELADGSLYVSMEYATAVHRCACGCGDKVVTPLRPTDWTLTFNGQVTLSPSVGNGQAACGSHYLIRENRIVWCRPMRRESAVAARRRDDAHRSAVYNRARRPSRLAQAIRWLRGRR